MLKKLNFLFVTMFGIGKLPRIPGSYASLATVILLYILFQIFTVPPDAFLFFLVAIFIISLFAVNLFIKDLSNKDPKEVVIDEFIGQSIPICLYEIAHNEPTDPARVLTFYFIMFILFRIFDIAKPYPVSYYDKNFKNSFGVIMDDVCAGLYVVAILVFYMIITS
jgi:phosphatidylglycerophosphatase A